MIWSIREARARVEGDGARGRRGWRRLGFVVAVAAMDRWAVDVLFVGGGERGAVSASSVGSKVGCCDMFASCVSGV